MLAKHRFAVHSVLCSDYLAPLLGGQRSHAPGWLGQQFYILPECPMIPLFSLTPTPRTILSHACTCHPRSGPSANPTRTSEPTQHFPIAAEEHFHKLKIFPAPAPSGGVPRALAGTGTINAPTAVPTDDHTILHLIRCPPTGGCGIYLAGCTLGLVSELHEQNC